MASAAAVTTQGAAYADDTAPAASSDAYAQPTSPNEEGAFLYTDSADSGSVSPMNWSGGLTGWGPGNKESRHWPDNDYTEIRFTGCTMQGATGKSVGVQLWQEIPQGFDDSIGTKTYSACFDGGTSKGEWNVSVSGGTQRYFELPELNGSSSTHALVSVDKIVVDTTKAD